MVVKTKVQNIESKELDYFMVVSREQASFTDIVHLMMWGATGVLAGMFLVWAIFYAPALLR